MLLPDTNARGAEGVAQRLMQVLEQNAIPHATSSVSEFVSVSVGLTSYEAPSHFAATSDSPPCVPHEWPEFAALLATADRALYAAKQSGRRRACMLALNAPADQAQTVARGGSHDPARRAAPPARPR
jgi:PleD family two-component response regulator